jgi:hypothetical protein
MEVDSMVDSMVDSDFVQAASKKICEWKVVSTFIFLHLIGYVIKMDSCDRFELNVHRRIVFTVHKKPSLDCNTVRVVQAAKAKGVALIGQ